MDAVFGAVGLGLLLAALLAKDVTLAGSTIPAPLTRIGRAVGAIAGVCLIGVALVMAGVLPPRPDGGGGGAPTPGGTDRVQVSNVYNLPKDRGLLNIKAQGFVNVRSIPVCSNSVAAGNIREVLLDNGASTTDETVLVGPTGSTIEVPLTTKILVKVSNGPCP
jgi:hypothetical protein